MKINDNYGCIVLTNFREKLCATQSLMDIHRLNSSMFNVVYVKIFTLYYMHVILLDLGNSLGF